MVSFRSFRLSTLFFVLCVTSYLAGQNVVAFKAQEPSPETHEVLLNQFSQYQVWQFTADDLAHLYSLSSGQDAVDLQISLPGQGNATHFQLYAHDLRADNFRSLRYRDGKAIAVPSGPVTNFQGYRDHKVERKAHFTIDPSFLMASWREGDHKRVVEPLWRLIPEAPRDRYVTYLAKDVLTREGACGTDHLPATQLGEKYHPTTPPLKLNGLCLIVDIALAADFQMFQAFGSVGSVESFMFGVLGDVQTNYDDEFADEIRYEVLTTFVSDCSSCDPWTGATGAGTLLDSFVSWGNNGGFGTTAYDVASLWTNRNLAGSTIGVAYLGAVCFSLRYNVLQNFTTNSESLRVLWSHELGHNFDATHDPSGSNTIMAPSVNQSTQWSAQSISQINSYVQFADCLDICEGTTPPDAAIDSPESFYCVGSTIPLFDISTGGPDSWFWEMPGATPSTSTEQHPRVTYNNPGSYTVTLFADNNAGGDIATFSIEIGAFDGATKFLTYETFEQGLGDWSSSNPDGRFGWEVTETEGNLGSFSAFVNNFDYQNGQGQVDALISPVFDLTLESNIILGLEYAYRRFSTSTSDILRIYASTDGGITFPDLLFQGQETGIGNFATGSITSQRFFPASEADWCGQGPGCIELDVSNYAGESDVVFRIENISDFGNNMFVDNIFLSANCETPEPPEPDFLYNPEIGCAPLDVTYLDITEGIVDFREWNFPGGDPEFSSDEEVVVTYFEPGIFEATLYVENSAGNNTLTINEAVQVLGLPNVSFTYIQEGNTFIFTANTDPEVFDLYWDFGDGNFNNDNDLMVTHTYAGPGTYVVELEVFNGCQTNTSTETIIIEPELTAAFTATPTEGCAPLAVQFTAEGEGDGYTYDWSFPGGNPASSSSRTPFVQYNSEGSFEVSLTVSRDGNSVTNTQTSYIVVADVPEASFTYTLNPGDAGPTVTNTSTGATDYLWNFGDGRTSTAETPLIIYDEAGTYTITLTATNDCGSDTFSETVTIIFPIVPDFTADAPAGCAPHTVTFTAIPQQEDLDYSWCFSGGQPNASTEVNPTILYTSAGSYQVSLSITNAAGTETTTRFDYIVVDDVPNTLFTATATPGSLTVQLDNQSTNADSYTYDFGDGNMASDNPTSYTYAAAGTYTITLTATNDCGSTSAGQEVSLILPVTPRFTASTTSGCNPLSVSFTAAPQVNGQTYAWSFPGGEPDTSSQANPTVTYNTAGTYDVSLSITNAAGTETTTETDYITVGAGPDAGFAFAYNIGDASVAFTSTSSNAATYSWDFGDDRGSDEANPTHTYTAEGTYTVVLTTTNACGSNNSEQEVSIIFPPSASISVDQQEGCAPLTVIYTAEPSRADYTYAWSFPGGEPATATSSTVVVSYATAGTYDASLMATNAAGSVSTSLSSPIVVLAAPTVSFTTDYTLGELTATFSAAATGVPDEDSAFQWNFGDGQTGTGQLADHTYAAAGTYTVSLTVTGPCGSVTTEESLLILTPPQGGFIASTTSGCAPLSIDFTAADQGEEFSYRWVFPGGDPVISTEANPSVTYATANSYSVILTVTNAADNVTTTETNYIVVGDRPEANFTTNEVLGELDVSFEAAASTATNWEWDFGDGNTATGQMVDHTYTTDGTYTVRLISSNACGGDTSFQTINLLLPPNAAIQASASTVCVDEVLELQALPTGPGYTYAWTLTGASPSSAADASVQLSYANPGTYTVELTVTNAAGSSSSSETVIVNAGPAANFTFSTNGLGATFTNNSTGADTYRWDFAGLGNSTDANPSFQFPATGNYPVTLIAENACGEDPFEATVVIEGQTPTVSFAVSNNSGCGPLEVSFNNTSTGGESWAWSFPGGEPATSDEENPTITYSTPGTYTVTLVAANAFGNSAFSREDLVTIQAPTVADFNHDLTVTTANFMNTSSGASSIEWQFPDGSTSAAANPTYTFPGNGTYTVTLIATGPCNTDMMSQEIVINGALPEVTISRDVEKGCAPLAVQFEDASTESPDSWAWSFPNGEPATSNAANPVVVYSEAGVYEISLTVSNAYGSSSETWMAYVEVEDVPTTSEIQQATFDGLTYGFTALPADETWDYLWTMPDSSTQETREAIYTFTESGNFPIQLEVSNNCGTTTLTDSVEININSIDSPEWAQQLALYPNPTAGDLQIRATGWPGTGTLEVRLYNNLGQRLQTQNLNLASGSWQHSLDLNNLPAGTYQLQFLWEGSWWTAKISKI